MSDDVLLAQALTPRFPYVSGRYYVPEGMERLKAGVAAATGTIRLTPGFVRSAITLANLWARVSTLSAGGLFQLALYASKPANGLPTGAPLFSSAGISTAATGIFSAASSLKLQAGRIWLGVNVDASGAAAAFACPNNDQADFHRLIGHSSTSFLLQIGGGICGYTKASAYGTWPTLTGDYTADALAVMSTLQGASCALQAA